MPMSSSIEMNPLRNVGGAKKETPQHRNIDIF